MVAAQPHHPPVRSPYVVYDCELMRRPLTDHMRRTPLVVCRLQFDRWDKSYEMADKFEMVKNVNRKFAVRKHFGFVMLKEGDVADRKRVTCRVGHVTFKYGDKTANMIDHTRARSFDGADGNTKCIDSIAIVSR